MSSLVPKIRPARPHNPRHIRNSAITRHRQIRRRAAARHLDHAMTVVFQSPTLETERLILRGPSANDAQAFIDFYASERSHMAGGPRDAREAWSNLAADFGHWVIRGFGMFTVTRKNSDRALGVVGHYYPHTRPEQEIGWVLFDASLEGQGIARKAALDSNAVRPKPDILVYRHPKPEVL